MTEPAEVLRKRLEHAIRLLDINKHDLWEADMALNSASVRKRVLTEIRDELLAEIGELNVKIAEKEASM